MGLQGALKSRKRAKNSYHVQPPSKISCSPVNEEAQPEEIGNRDFDGPSPKIDKPLPHFSIPGRPSGGYTDGRLPYDWKSKYDPGAQVEIAYEEKRLLSYLGISLVLAAFSLMLSGQAIRMPLPFEAVSSN